MSQMDADEDISSPKVQRKMWRRVWIGLAIFVIVTPVLLWVAIDQNGKREWQRVQAELHAKGEATTIAELDLATGDEILDEENFGSLILLRADDAGTASEASRELNRQLQLFDMFDREEKLKFDGNVFIGMASDLEAGATAFDNASGRWRVGIPKSKANDALSRISAYLDLHSELWNELLEAVDRRHAQRVPSMAERLATTDIPLTVAGSSFWQINLLSTALKWRALVALRKKDTETFLRCFEVSCRLLELAGNEQNFLGVVMAIICHQEIQPALVEALWDEEFVSALGDSGLKRLQASQQRTNLQTLLETGMRGELVLLVETFQRLSSHRSSAPEGHMFPDSALTASKLAPKGWFLSSAAYGAELFDRHLFESFRKKQPMIEVIAAAERMSDETRRLNTLERFNYIYVCMAVPDYSKIPQEAAYAEARRRQAILVLALHRFQLENDGAFPDSLDTLVPAYLDSVPSDPMDGHPMRYQLTNDPGDFRLWSVGFDGTDDDGELNLTIEEPESTRVDRDTYIGDWPWPTEPREFVRPEQEEKAQKPKPRTKKK